MHLQTSSVQALGNNASIVQTMEDIRGDLATEVLQSSGSLRIRAYGVSMLPTLQPGDLLTIQATTIEQTMPGEIVLMSRQGRFFVHRVVKKICTGRESSVVTRGDCMVNDDPVGGALLGRVAEIRRGSSLIVPTRELSPVRQAIAWMLCYSGLLQRVALRLYLHRSRVGPDFALPIRPAAF
jgi:hypothetical protein